MPFYKQAGRLAASLPLLGSDIHALLTSFAQHPLLTEDFTDEWDPVEAIESFAEKCVLFLTENGLSRARGTWLWDHGPSLMESVHDPLLRRQNLLAL